MQEFNHHCIIDEISYNNQELIDLFNRIPKKCELPWNQYKNVIKDANPNRVYSSGRKFQRRGEGGLRVMVLAIGTVFLATGIYVLTGIV